VTGWLLVVTVLLVNGCCVITGDALRELVQSERSWCLMRADWTGTLRISGTGLRNGTVSCSFESMVVTSEERDVK
jgi:hypothetical protein